MMIMIYMLNDNKLPWSDFQMKNDDGEDSFSEFLNQRLDLKYTKELFKMSPRSLRRVLREILVLKFDEKPNYRHYIDKIKAEMMKEVEIGPNF